MGGSVVPLAMFIIISLNTIAVPFAVFMIISQICIIICVSRKEGVGSEGGLAKDHTFTGFFWNPSLNLNTLFSMDAELTMVL